MSTLQNDISNPTIRATMTTERKQDAPAESSRTLIIVVAILATVVILGFFYFLAVAGRGTPSGPITLQGAIRPGNPEFEANVPQKLVLDDPEATEAKRPLGDTVMTLTTTVRNLTGKTLSGLEMRASVVDHQDQPVKQRTVIIVPDKKAELAPNKTLPVNVVLEGFKDTDDRANIKMEVTGFKFKE
jgi:hypothetical protein